MTSIIKVDQIQTAAGATPTASDLGINSTSTSMPTGAVLQVKQTNIADGAVSFNGDVSDIISLSITPLIETPLFFAAMSAFKTSF